MAGFEGYRELDRLYNQHDQYYELMLAITADLGMAARRDETFLRYRSARWKLVYRINRQLQRNVQTYIRRYS